MRKEERERLHEADPFVKFVSAVWSRISGRRSVVLGALIAAGILLIAAILMSVREDAIDRARGAVDMAQTIDEMEQVRKSQPRSAELLRRLGIAYAQRGKGGDMAAAESALETALDAAEDDFRAALTALELGKVKSELGKHEEALKLFERAARNRDAQPIVGGAATWYAARCLERLGRRDEAAEKYRDILRSPLADDLWRTLAEARQTQLRQEALE